MAGLSVAYGQAVRPTITLQPQSQTVAAGSDVTFVVSASGTLPMNYSWRRNGTVFTNIPANENTSLFTLRDVQTNHAGGWRVGISNIAGPASGGLSSNAILTVRSLFSATATLIAESCTPGNGVPDPGEMVTFEFALANTNAPGTSNLVATLEASGGILLPSAPQTYEGLFYGGPPVARQFTFVADAACGSNVFASLRLWDGTNDLGRVRFVFRVGPTNGECCYDAAFADLALTMSGPILSGQPGTGIEYQITVANRGPGTATGVHLINPAQPGLQLVSATSSSGTCAVNESGLVCDLTDLPRDASTTVTILANLSGPQWISVTNMASVSAAQRDDKPANNTETVVMTPPTITVQPQPQSQVVLALTNVTFSIVAHGTGLTYQWQKSGANLTDGGRVFGAQTATLTLSNILPADAGRYSVTVQNALATVPSSNAVLAVVPLVVWGTTNSSGQTSIPLSLTNVTAVAAGMFHNLGLKADGTVVGWGQSFSGETNVPPGLSNVMAVAAGDRWSLVLQSNGTVLAWGSSPATNVPPGLSSVMTIVAGGLHGLALKENGTVISWGSNTYGQTNVPPGLSNVIAVAASYFHSLALRSDGRVVAWGRNAAGEANVPAGLSNVIAIAAGNSFSLAAKADGTATAWGSHVPLTGLSNVVAVAAASQASSSLALKADGTVMMLQACCGLMNVPFGLTNVLSAALGFQHSLVLLGWKPEPSLTPGAVVSWGGDEDYLGNVPDEAQSGVVAIAAGYRHTVALKTNGSVLAWGYNNIGQTTVPVAAQSGVTAIAAGYRHTVALKNDGSVVAWGDNWEGQTTVPVAAQSGVTAIAAGLNHTVALKANGSVVAWGDNGFGQTNVPVAAQSGVKAITAGYYHTVALKNDGSVLAWGHNSYGQTTVPVAAQSGVTAIAAGGIHTVALKRDGSVVTWGYNGNGQTTVPVAAQSAVVAIAAGGSHTVALKRDGSVLAWGRNSYGQTSVPVAAQSGVTAIAAGLDHTVALVNLTPPIITTQPVSLAVNAGQSASFTVAATGYPLNYQWRKDGTNLNGLPDSTYRLDNTWFDDAGSYTVVVSNFLGSVTSSPPAVLAVNPALAGSVVAWGGNWIGQTTVPLSAQSGMTAIAAGSRHTVALKSDGSVVAWGNNYSGQTTVPVAAQSGVVAIAAGGSHTVALKSDGSVVAWGDNFSGQTTVPVTAQSGVTAIAAGGYHTVALKMGGSVLAWGSDGYGQTTVPVAAQSGVTAIAAGLDHTVALLGTVLTRPSLQARPGVNELILSWPADAVGFTLQSTLSLTPPVTWMDVTDAPSVIDAQFTVTNTLSGSAQFYRLKKP